MGPRGRGQRSYGSEGGANPTIVTRITTSVVAPGTYLLAIDFKQPDADLTIDYQTESPFVGS